MGAFGLVQIAPVFLLFPSKRTRKQIYFFAYLLIVGLIAIFAG